MSMGDFLANSNDRSVYFYTVLPENDPERTTKWNGPYFIKYEMMMQSTTPIYGRNDELVGGVLATITMSATSYLLESVKSTPGGFK